MATIPAKAQMISETPILSVPRSTVAGRMKMPDPEKQLLVFTC